MAQWLEHVNALDRIDQVGEGDRDLRKCSPVPDLVHPNKETSAGVIDLRVRPHDLVGFELYKWQTEQGSQEFASISTWRMMGKN
jgi:hypothetical protein